MRDGGEKRRDRRGPANRGIDQKKIPNQKKQKRKWLLGGNKSERFEQGSMTRVSYLSTMTYTYHIYMHKIEDLKKERDRRGGNSPCF